MKNALYLIKSISILATLTLSQAALASDFTNDKCSRVLTHSGNIQISRDWDQDTSFCYLSIHPMDVENLTYRDYMFTNTGMMMIFNSYGEGSTSTTTGAREFYLFPRNGYPDYRVEENGDVTVKMVSGHLMRFDTKTFRIVSVTDGKVVEASSVNSKNNGGVELSLSRGLLLDIGFTMGKSPSSVKDKKIMFHDVNSKTCSLRNRDIFVYQGENAVITLNDEQLKVKFTPKCPGLAFH